MENALVTQGAGLITATRADQNPAAVYLRSLAHGSQRTMKEALDVVAKKYSGGQFDHLTFPWQELRYQHTQAMRADLRELYSAATVNKQLSAVRRVMHEAWRLGLMTAEQYKQAADVKNLKQTTLPAGRHVHAGEVQALIEACRQQDRPIDIRDGALLGVSFCAGLRVGEVVALDLGDFDAATGELIIRHGKGDKQRTAYVRGGALAVLLDWLQVRGAEPGALFCPVRKNGKVALVAMSTQAVWSRFQLRARQAGLSAKFSPHDGRRTWIGNLLDAGVDLVTAQKMAGHASVDTTGRYDRRDERAKRDAADLLHFPWGARVTSEDA
jgi:site-specific recombinase XerC